MKYCNRIVREGREGQVWREGVMDGGLENVREEEREGQL